MAFKLTRDESNQRTAIADKLRLEAAQLEEAVNDFNTALQAARAQLEIAQSSYNSIAEEARNFISEVQGRLTDEFDNKSDRWKEGDKASIVAEWIETWTEAASSMCQDMELEMPEDIDLPTIEDADNLENLEAEYPL